jgi:1-acyl-sn-glycerol-3-phosphate acyltransferase
MMWATVSPCGPHCLPGDEAWPAGPVHRAARLAGLVAVVAGAAALVPVLPGRWRARAVRGCARATLRALGVRWSIAGRLPARRALVVANHISWLDTLVLLAAGRSRLVAKAEVRGWPLVGPIAGHLGGVFLDRTRPRTLPGTVGRVRDILAAGGVVAVFPEGTTSCGEGAGGFRPAFFQAAIDAGVPVVPTTLRYQAAGIPTARAAFIGAETLLESLGRVLAMRGLTVRVCVGTAIHPGPAASRRTIARIAAAAVGCQPAGRAVPLAPVVPFAAAPKRLFDLAA